MLTIKDFRKAGLREVLESSAKDAAKFIEKLMSENESITTKGHVKQYFCEQLSLDSFPDDCKEPLQRALDLMGEEEEGDEGAKEGDAQEESKMEEQGKSDEDEQGASEEASPQAASSSEDSSDGDEKRRTKKARKEPKDQAKKEKKNKNKETDSALSSKQPSPASKKVEPEDPKVEFLKRCILACGMRRQYSKLFGPDASTAQKIAKLEHELREFGVKGRITLKACKEAVEHRELQELQRESARFVTKGDSSSGQRRRLARKTVRTDSEEESEEASPLSHTAPHARAPATKRLPMQHFDTSFLGSDSDD